MGKTRTPHRVYLVSGMFGFGRLAGYDYFGHVGRAIETRFAAEGVPVVVEVIAPPPTASMRRRAAVVAQAISASAGGGDSPIHIVGHSTGGLDARLVASPTTNLHLTADAVAWQKRLRSVVTINTPHYGTPLAAFFTTAAGTRLLYAISLLTVTTLSLGGLPLSAFSSLVAAVGSIDKAMGIDIRLLDRTTSLLLRIIGERTRGEVLDWFGEIRGDQGGIVQIMPEAMDVFNAALEDNSKREKEGTLTGRTSLRRRGTTNLMMTWTTRSRSLRAMLSIPLSSRCASPVAAPREGSQLCPVGVPVFLPREESQLCPVSVPF